MNRRSLLKLCAWLTGGGAAAAFAPPPLSAQTNHSIVLYCDMSVDPAREQEMLDAFHHHFKPVAKKFDGYIDVKIVKLRKVVAGGPPPPAGVNYRFQLNFESEEKRQVWIHSAVHQQAWPLIENTFTDKNYLTLLTDNQ